MKPAAAILAGIATAATALSLTHPHSNHHRRIISKCSSTTALHLQDPRKGSELDNLQSRRDQLKKAAMEAAAQPKQKTDGPRYGKDIDNMSKEELQAYMASMGNADIDNDVEAMMAGQLSFKTKRVPSKQAERKRVSRPKNPEDNGGDDEEEQYVYIDDNDGRYDENTFHVPNRIGFTTACWTDVSKGFVNGKLKKTDRKNGKFNKADLKKAYSILQKSGITLIETSESYGKSETILSKIDKNVELLHGPDIASTFPNPWKHALKTRSRPRAGADAVCSAAERACKRLGLETMTLYQVENPWYYLGGTNALGAGMLEVIQEGHAQYVGCIDMSVSKLYKLQKYLRKEDEMVASNQFEFSLTNRKNEGMIAACKDMGITPICRNVLDGGLASGKYTPTTPTGGKVSMDEGGAKGPYSLRTLEKLNALFQTMESLTTTVSKRIKSESLNKDKEQRPNFNSRITTTQIAINYVKAKGAVPLLSINNPREANELLGCLGWELNEDEVEELEKACKVCGL
eukprot:scaffold38199_cov54-Cyclotella_meneghiniana.AAC.2